MRPLAQSLPGRVGVNEVEMLFLVSYFEYLQCKRCIYF